MPAWSPDGKKILYDDDDTNYGDNYQGAGIYTINPTPGSSPTPVLLQSNWHTWFPHYSTDGKKILYAGDPYTNGWGIWSINSDGTGTPAPIIDPSLDVGAFDCSKCQSFGN